MIDDCHIRKFRPGDQPRLQAIREAAFRPVFRSFRELVGEDIAEVALASAEQEQANHLDSLCGTHSPHHVYVVEHRSEVVAFFALSVNRETRVGEIDLNAVDPEFQGRGIGARMYDFALDLMRAEGMRVATVGTGGDASHAPARRAYEKAGFLAAIPNLYLYRSL